MTSLNTQLWELILNHKMPADASGVPFENQLMAENSISRETADVAISEYRKFMYLCATRPERNVPSKAVDLVWHLHMQHSRDYWDVFCRKLGKPVHHTPGSPTAGHLDDYKKTVAAYTKLFGTPPKGIWKQSKTLGTMIGLAGSGIFAVVIFGTIQNEGPSIALVVWLIVLLIFFASLLHSMTERGQVTLVFESGDPFADNDAGDCGSGDGGGCGD